MSTQTTTAPRPPHIATETWEPSPGKPGFIRWQAQRSMYEVKADIIETLKHIDASDSDEDFYSAEDVREWITPTKYTGEDIDGDFPRGDTIVSVQRGANEGYHRRILSRSRNSIETVFTIKYLLSRDTVWRIAQALDLAFEIY